jgi:outer membrane protein TolC
VSPIPALASPTAIDVAPPAGNAPLTRSGSAFFQIPGGVPGVRRITLAQAQQLATPASSTLTQLAELQVEAARQHRLGVKSLYFPNVSTQFGALELSETPGEVLSVRRPLTGGFFTVPVAVVEQDQLIVNVAVTQPITQLFGVRQLVKIARADENIARLKAGQPVTELARRVENNYYDLLIAERELVVARAEAGKVRGGLVTVSDSAVIGAPSVRQADTLRAETVMVLAASKVKALTASLNALIGLPPDTELELVPPDPLVESLTLAQVVAQGAAVSAEVLEAQQTVVKAQAASKLSKLAYGPSVALVGGYTHQNSLVDAILPSDFAYIGVVGTYTLFDSFKRERAVKEATAQARAAELGVDLAREKAVAAVTKAYFELERSRDVYQLARRIASPPSAIGASYVSDTPDVAAARARTEADMFRAEMEYRESYARLQSLMGAN